MHKGTLVSVSGQNVTMSHDDGSPNDVHVVTTNATVMLNGKPSKLADLSAGCKIELNDDPATTVKASC